MRNATTARIDRPRRPEIQTHGPPPPPPSSSKGPSSRGGRPERPDASPRPGGTASSSRPAYASSEYGMRAAPAPYAAAIGAAGGNVAAAMIGVAPPAIAAAPTAPAAAADPPAYPAGTVEA